MTLDSNAGAKAFKLLTADNKGIQLSFGTHNPSDGEGSWWFGLNGVGTGGGKNSGFVIPLPGWNTGYAFNEVKIVVQQGVAKVYTNGSNATHPVVFEADQVFNRVSFEGFTAADRNSYSKNPGRYSNEYETVLLLCLRRRQNPNALSLLVNASAPLSLRLA